MKEEGLGILKAATDSGVVHKIRHISSPCGEYRLACGGSMSWDRKTTDKAVNCKKCLSAEDIDEETT